MSEGELHSSWFTSGPRFAMVNFVPARFHRRRFKHEIKLFVSNWKINCHFWKELIMLEIRTRVILIIWKKSSPWCTKPALCHFHRQTRGIGRRVKRPLTGPNLNVRGVSVDSSLLRPLAGPKPTGQGPNSRCTAMKLIDDQIQKKDKWTNPAIHQRAVPASTLRCQSNERQTLKNPPLRSVTTGSCRSIDQIFQMQKKKSVAVSP